MKALRVTAYVGARPNLPKAWTLQCALGNADEHVRYRVVHTGQHFSPALSTEMASELGLMIDKYCATPRSVSDADQLANLMRCVEADLEAWTPDCVVAIGDVNSTVAAAVVAARMGIPVVHLEAGLRSDDRCPEDVNRRIVSSVASCHLCPTETAVANLLSENMAQEQVHFVGNAMIECLLAKRSDARAIAAAERFCVAPGEYAVLTAHKPVTLSDPRALIGMCEELASSVARVLFPCHPHTLEVLKQHRALQQLPANVELLPPIGYLEFTALVEQARVVVTDSDGVQEECCVTGTPCCIMSDHTARRECVTAGIGFLVGLSPSRLRSAFDLSANPTRPPAVPKRWDGLVSERIRQAVLAFGVSLGKPRTWRARPLREPANLHAPA